MKKILKIFITMLILIILLLLYSRFIGTIGLNTKEYTIEDNNISNDFDGIKIVHFSDIHYKRIITKDRIDKIINEINLINPDIVIFTGDLIDQDSEINEDDITYLKEVLSKINAKYGKYSVIGNHDYSIDIEILRNIYKESNFNLLENSYDSETEEANVKYTYKMDVTRFLNRAVGYFKDTSISDPYTV